MATISLRDRMSAKLMSVQQKTGKVISSLKLTRKASENMLSTSKIAEAKAGMEAVDTKVRAVGSSLRKADAEQNKFNRDIKGGGRAASYLKGQLMGVAKAAAAYATIHAGVTFAKESIQSANDRAQAETKLDTVMRQRMGATNQMIEATKKLTAVQQDNGVIADDVQMAGVQQLSTFLNSTKALNTLIPAMNDLATQQHGVAVSAGDEQNIANMMGKAMQGQVGALSRVGITFSDAEAHVLKFGTEEQRAATMAQIITNNVGHMNEALAATPAGKMAQMANTWEGIKQMVGAQLYPSVMQLFNALQSNMPTVERAFHGVAFAIGAVISALWVLAQISGTVGNFMADHWGIIEPIIWGIVAALAAYKLGMATVAVTTKIATIATKQQTAAEAGATVATGGLAVAWRALNAAMKANPIVLIISVIIAIIAAIAAWVHHVGGLHIAWLIVTNGIMTASEYLCIKFSQFCLRMGGYGDKIALTFGRLKVSVLNHLGDLRVKGLTLLQSFVNGAIDIINKLIDKVNLIPGIAIDHVQHVTFATRAATENEAKKAARNADLKKQEKTIKEQEKQSKMALQKTQSQFDAAHKKRLSAIEKAQKAQKAKPKKDPGLAAGGAGMPNSAAAALGKSAAATAGNTAKMAKSMSLSQKDTKRIRDMAERETINRFTTAEIQINQTNHNAINSNLDLDGIVDHLTEAMNEAVSVAAEGVHE